MIRRSIMPLVVSALCVLSTACESPLGGSSGAAPADERAQPLPDSAEESETRRRARIRVELAASYYQQRNLSVALDEARQALVIESGYGPALGLLGLIYMDLGDRPRAEDSFRRALHATPNDSDLNNNYGWFLCQTGRERASLDHFNRAVRNPLYATPAKPLHNAGICLRRAGDDTAAEGYLQRAFQLDPRDPVAMYQLGDLYLKRRELERARFYVQRLVSAFEPSAEVLWLALRVERASGNRDGEASYGAQLRRRFPQSPEAISLTSGQYEQ
jgi:type IV pilus assembly protein PilF